MGLEIKEEKENKLLGRKELTVAIAHLGAPTPKKQDIAKELSSKYSVPEDQVVIDYLFTKKGIGESLAKAKILSEKPKLKEPKKEEIKNEAQASETK
jgi:small subunit ribosomal protein S24e